MSINLDDPRLTLYALDEMEHEEKTAFERELEGDAQARAEVESIRRLAAQVETALDQEPAESLRDQQRAAVTAAALAPATEAERTWSRWWWALPPVAAAAALAVSFATTGPMSVRDADLEVTARVDAEKRERASAEYDRVVDITGIPTDTDVEVETTAGVALDKLAPNKQALEDAVRNVPEKQTIALAESKYVDGETLTLQPKPAAKAPSIHLVRPGNKLPSVDLPPNWRGPAGGVPPGTRPPTDSEPPPPPPSDPADTAGPIDVRAKELHALIEEVDKDTAKYKIAPKDMARVRGMLLQAEKQARLMGRVTVDARQAKLVEMLRRYRNQQPKDREGYDAVEDNPFRTVTEHDTSTWSVDVDTASYANVRRMLNGGALPPRGAVRIEEMVNYFPYSYAPPSRGNAHPFAWNVEIASCPWNAKHRLARIALKGKTMKMEERPPTNLVFLVDVSGSMRPQNKLPLVQQSLRLLAETLDEGDRVAMVVYAGAAGCVLPSTTGDKKDLILGAIDRLRSGGSTNGGAGIQLAYKLAREHFIKGGVNRVVLATDGDFNVGITDRSSLVGLIEREAKSGVFLSLLGYGMGNLRDGQMEELSNKGNGNYAYIDTLNEAKKVLVEEVAGTLVTIAKDVKVQVFFNPKAVAGYRLIGYENRALEKQDFNDDQKDAGEIGAGHAVTALYELIPAGTAMPGPRVDENPFTNSANKAAEDADPNTLFQLRLRYKLPEAKTSTLLEQDVRKSGLDFDSASEDFRFAASVAGFGMMLRKSPHSGTLQWAALEEIAASALGKDEQGYRKEFVSLVKKARALAGQ